MYMKKILVVEDDYALRGIYVLILSQAQFDVDVAVDGTSALEAIKENSYDLVLLDLMMPNVDGKEVLKEIRRHDWGKNVRVVVLTNIGITEKTLNLKQYGVLETALKVDLLPEDLVALVQKHL